ncbi:MAG: dTDP-4-dehydrorhamnose reductase [Thermodesulfobacteriota bacterium]
MAEKKGFRVLISGATGQLGSDCTDLLSSGHTVFPFSSAQLDISSRDTVDDTVKETSPDIIVNCGAYTAVDLCETEQERAMGVNANGPAYLAAAASRHNARLIHISTDYVFDGRKAVPAPYLEDDAVGPLSIYGKSKLAGERGVQENCADSLILRTAWLYGHRGKNFLKTMLRLTLADRRREIRVVNDQYGSLTWTHSLARQVEQLLDSRLCGIAHATAEGYCTWFEGACYFLDRMEVPHNLAPCTTADYPTPAPRPNNSILENGLLKREGLMVMQDWKKDIDVFVGRYRDTLLQEAQS